MKIFIYNLFKHKLLIKNVQSVSKISPKLKEYQNYVQFFDKFETSLLI